MFFKPVQTFYSLRNLFFGITLLMCWIQVLDFLAFHPLFGPWAIIIGECLLDVGKFVVVLSLFIMGYSMLASTMNQPFGFPTDYIKVSFIKFAYCKVLQTN